MLIDKLICPNKEEKSQKWDNFYFNANKVSSSFLTIGLKFFHANVAFTQVCNKIYISLYIIYT